MNKLNKHLVVYLILAGMLVISAAANAVMANQLVVASWREYRIRQCEIVYAERIQWSGINMCQWGEDTVEWILREELTFTELTTLGARRVMDFGVWMFFYQLKRSGVWLFENIKEPTIRITR